MKGVHNAHFLAALLPAFFGAAFLAAFLTAFFGAALLAFTTFLAALGAALFTTFLAAV